MKTVDRDALDCVRGVTGFARRAVDEVGLGSMTTAAHNVPMVNHEIVIRDARPIEEELSLDREGFVLVKHEARSLSEVDRETKCDRYIEELTPFIKEYLKASWVVPRRRGVILRDRSVEAIPRDFTRVGGPANYAHMDYSPIAGPMMAALANEEQGTKTRSYSRLMIIQTWRAFSPPPQDFPLALCDASSVSGGDLLQTDYQTRGIVQKYWLPYYNPNHRWYYFPNMMPNELLLFKGYDSERHFEPATAHTAFDNRPAFPNANPRESIDARFFVYFD
ncbi:CmcJ/NvfI family oxidoreductase [Bradyrhizobium sp. 1.29L]